MIKEPPDPHTAGRFFIKAFAAGNNLNVLKMQSFANIAVCIRLFYMDI
jgi:hypothetical protein